jgi:hypothetical protein
VAGNGSTGEARLIRGRRAGYYVERLHDGFLVQLEIADGEGMVRRCDNYKAGARSLQAAIVELRRTVERDRAENSSRYGLTAAEEVVIFRELDQDLQRVARENNEAWAYAPEEKK